MIIMIILIITIIFTVLVSNILFLKHSQRLLVQCFSVTNAKLDECERGRKLVSGDCHNLLSVDHSTVIFIGGWQNLIQNASSTWTQIVYFKTPDVNGSRLISYWNLEYRYHRNFMTVSILFGSCFPPCLQ